MHYTNVNYYFGQFTVALDTVKMETVAPTELRSIFDGYKKTIATIHL